MTPPTHIKTHCDVFCSIRCWSGGKSDINVESKCDKIIKAMYLLSS